MANDTAMDISQPRISVPTGSTPTMIEMELPKLHPYRGIILKGTTDKIRTIA